jgi:CDP-glycerol glycerophosphotransferase
MHWDRHNPRNPIKKSSPHFYAKSTGWDILLSPNHYSTEKFRSCFKFKGKILESGYPANDIFYIKEKYESKRVIMRKKLGISDDALVYLYAPTWRDGGHIGHSMFKFDLLFDPIKFLDNAPENSILLIRSHHMSEATKELSILEGRAIDVSDWDDAVELMCASDILITDYSSIVFDWYCSKKPVIYYVPDLEEYENETRGAYFDIDEVNCGVICKSEDELYNNLNVTDAPFYKEFYDEFCSLHSGNSSDKVIEYIMNRNKVPKKSKFKNIFKGMLQ